VHLLVAVELEKAGEGLPDEAREEEAEEEQREAVLEEEATHQ
jgi:hypothetical protein